MSDVKSADSNSEYSHAWAEYHRRWLAAWTIPLFLIVCYVGNEIITHNTPWVGWLIAAFVAYVFFYLRFMR